jgi:uncharacterized repeat protein (TIGR02543 family)
MKVTFKLLGIIVIAAITGFSMAACEEPDSTSTPTYTVTFNSNGGGAVAPMTVTSGGMISRPTNPERDLYFFNGWYRDDSSFKDKWNFSTDTVTRNTTLYADWLLLSGINEADFGPSPSIERTFDVTNTAEWDAAASAIADGGNSKNYIINIMNNFSITGIDTGDTFGNYRLGIISIRGDGMTLSLSGNGYLLKIGNQTLILRNVTLQGHSTNNRPLVYIIVGGIIMNGGKISGNTNTGSVITEGGGVFIYGGTFTMNSGEISGNTAVYGGGVLIGDDNGTFTMNSGEISGNTAAYGGGVYIRGIFTMNNGEISGNTSRNGGGVYMNGTFTMNNGEISDNTGTGVDVKGTFTMNNGEISGNTGAGVDVGRTFRISNGIIYGSNAAGNLKNTRALVKSADATAERGTFTGTGGSWLKTDDLPTTDNTIRIVGGTLLQ